MAAPTRSCIYRIVNNSSKKHNITNGTCRQNQHRTAICQALSFEKFGIRTVGSSSNIGQIDGGTRTETTHGKVLQISRAVQSYLQKADEHDKMLAHHQKEFDLGKRYLAKMMGADPQNFSQQDIDEAISYLLPSGLFSKRARPQMKPPAEVFPHRKAAEFDNSGRPYHFLFYTGLPNYYDLMHTVACKIEDLPHRPAPESTNSKFLESSDWLSQKALESHLVENIKEQQYERFKRLITKLAEHPKAALEKEFLMKYRVPLSSGHWSAALPSIQVEDEMERRYVQVEGKRKNATAKITLWERGTGVMNINGRGLADFPELYQREQIMTPLAFVDKIGAVDCEGVVEGVGESSRAGALRLALSLGLAAFESQTTQEQMRQAGLLTRDPRKREREKPGQKGARAKKTWKKR